mgnify:CR=1 FL=1
MSQYFFKYQGVCIDEEKAYFPSLNSLFNTLSFNKKMRKSVYNRMCNRELVGYREGTNRKVLMYKKNDWSDKLRQHKIERKYFYTINFQ